MANNGLILQKSNRTVPIIIYIFNGIYSIGCDTLKEEGSETINSMAILAVFLGVAFAVSAVLPASGVISDDFKPLEVNKIRISGPAVVVVGNQALWDLQITAINNLDTNFEDVEDELEDEEPNFYYPSMSTRSDGEAGDIEILDPSTITDVVVSDKLPAQFTLLEYIPSQGNVVISSDDSGSTVITWSIGNLAPQAVATLDLAVIVEEFKEPGTYILNSGASVTGVLYSNNEILIDGPTKSILVTVTDGTPNDSPIAEAGVDQMAFDGNPIYLDGSGSFDPDGMVTKYTWFLGEEHVGSSKSVLSYHFSEGVYEVTLIVEDNRGAVDSDTVTITIYNENAVMPGGAMYGIVRDATTRQGFDPYIQVWNDDFAISTWTDMGGNYRIIGIPPGEYQTYCEAEGYQDFFGEITITGASEVLYDFDMIRT